MTTVQAVNEGCFTYENWRLIAAGEAEGDTLEYPLYTDVRLEGEVTSSLGPYQLLNAIREPDNLGSPAAFVRVTHSIRQGLPSMATTTFHRYHAGYLEDEIAALLAVDLGARFKAAGATRWFRPGSDPKGRPWSFRHFRQATPILQAPTHGPMMPALSGTRRLTDLLRLRRLLDMTPAGSAVLVRAARLYQEGIWIADQAPELAWLLLVSAAEVAAGFWRATVESPIDRLRASRPELEHLLQEAGCDGLVPAVAAMVAPYMGSTTKFVAFMLEFLPPPPDDRPPQHEQISWTRPDLKKALGMIYDYRSKALHAGTPFPAPMCMPPRGESGEERPIGTAAGAMGGVWLAADMPMMLHTFELLVRGALQRWWDSLLARGTEVTS